MKITELNKLVRDEIVPQLTKKGIQCEWQELTDAEMSKALDNKLQEELREFLDADEPDKLEEIADIIAVLIERAKRLGYSTEQLDDAVITKAMLKGGFTKNIFLKRTIEN